MIYAIRVMCHYHSKNYKIVQPEVWKRLCNLRSGNLIWSGSRILVIPLDVGLLLAGPFFVDLEEDCAVEAR